ncbi:DNA methyltransferase [Sphingobium yanoikuyae]|nr:site-specific DNA-methyltransferase [Sphingobium yanoikuyae]
MKDGKQTDISREPEQVKAFRDTWKDGIHSYLTYLRDRLTAMRDLLTESGSIFVQIGDEHVHRVRAVLDEVFGENNFVSNLVFKKTGGQSSSAIANVNDFILWYAKDRARLKSRPLYNKKAPGDEGATNYEWLEEASGVRRPMNAREKVGEIPLPSGCKIMQPYPMFSDGPSQRDRPLMWRGAEFKPSSNAHWKTHGDGLQRVVKADRFVAQGKTLRFVNYLADYEVTPLLNIWTDTQTSGFGADRVYIVQTLPKVVERCILMSTDPGDLVLDPTCGSGTTAYVAEQRGRRWITTDTSRVALALARTRLMSARYPWYLLADSREGRAKEAALTQTVPPETLVHNDIRQGFVYERVPHITLKSIANNPLIDDIWEKWRTVLEPLRTELNAATGEAWEEWQIPRALPATAPPAAVDLHARWWEARIARQREIDASIAARADVEYLYDKPYTDPARVRVAGPFTVESLSPHRVLPASEEELIETAEAADGNRSAADADLAGHDFAAIVMDYLKAEGVKQQAKGDRITFESIVPWPGNFIGAAATFIEGENGPERRAAILIGPEYGTVGRQDLVAAAREAVDNRFDVLIACAFNFDAHSSELDKLGSLTILTLLWQKSDFSIPKGQFP